MIRLLAKVSGGILVAMLLAFGLVALLLGHSLERRVRQRLVERTQGGARVMCALLDRAPRAGLEARRAELESMVGKPVRLVDRAAPELRAIRGRLRPHVPFLYERPGGRFVVYTALRNHPKVLALGPASWKRVVSAGDVVTVVAIATAVGLLVALLLVAPMARRITAMEQTAAALAAGRLEARVDAHDTSHVLDRLAAHLNEMADRLEALVASQRTVMERVSHDLRTPISRIRFSLEMLASDLPAGASAGPAPARAPQDGSAPATENAQAPETATETTTPASETAQAPETAQALETATAPRPGGRARIEAIGQDLDEMDRLVDEILRYARLRSASRPLDLQAVPVVELARNLVAYLPELQAPGVGVQVHGVPAPGDSEEDLLLPCDERYLRRCLQNLIANGLRHADSQVRVRILDQGDAVRILVEDDGPGVPPAERHRVFEPFVRLGHPRTGSGVGLGLAVAKAILESHGGTISVERSDLGGACFVTEWPKSPPSGASSPPPGGASGSPATSPGPPPAPPNTKTK